VAVNEQVATGAQTTLRFQVLAPKTPGLTQACFELRAGAHGFFDSTPQCWSVQVDEAAEPMTVRPVSTGAPEGQVAAQPVGCSSAPPVDAFAALVAVSLLRRRNGRRGRA